MEYVDGISITRYCRERALSISQRLTLFQQACTAVRYAHQKLIIHSDLKPEHVLVDKDGQIKLLDFGLARLEEQQLGESTIEKSMFTPAYASPEQIAGHLLTTSSDVYSLGVIFYELLTDSPPFNLKKKSPIQALKIVSETTPSKPSLKSNISKELDYICLKALEKESDVRYTSVEALSADLDCYEKGLPISAKQKNRGYLLKKYLQRNALATLSSMAIIITIIATVVFYTLKMQQEQQEAIAQLERAETLSDFLQGLFDTKNRRGNYAADITAKKLVDNGARRVENELKDQPNERVVLMRTIGTVYRRLGLLHPAEKLHRRGLDLALQHYSKESLEVLESRRALADALFYTGKYVEAESLLTAALQIAGNSKRIDYNQRKHCAVLNLLGKVKRRQKKNEEAMLIYEDALRLAEAIDDMGPRLTSMNNLATSYSRAGRLAEAEQMYNQLLPLSKEYHGDYHPQIAIVVNNLGALYRRTGRMVEAKKMYEESLWRRERIYGDNHPGLCLALSNLAGLYMINGDLETSIKLLRRSVRISKGSHGRAHPYVQDNLRRIIKNLTDLKRFNEAEEALQELTDITLAEFDETHLYRVKFESAAGRFYRKKKEMDKAEKHYRRAVEIVSKTMPSGEHTRYKYIYSMARFLQDRERYAEAEPFFLESFELIEKNVKQLNKKRPVLLKYMIKLYENMARPEEVEKYTEMLEAVKPESKVGNKQ